VPVRAAVEAVTAAESAVASVAAEAQSTVVAFAS